MRVQQTAKDLQDRAAQLRRIYAMCQRAPLRLEPWREALRQLVEEALGDRLDPDIIARECALQADRIDVSEEMARLLAHLQRLDELLQQEDGEPQGRSLEFLLQELGREVNHHRLKIQRQRAYCLWSWRRKKYSSRFVNRRQIFLLTGPSEGDPADAAMSMADYYRSLRPLIEQDVEGVFSVRVSGEELPPSAPRPRKLPQGDLLAGVSETPPALPELSFPDLPDAASRLEQVAANGCHLRVLWLVCPTSNAVSRGGLTPGRISFCR